MVGGASVASDALRGRAIREGFDETAGAGVPRKALEAPAMESAAAEIMGLDRTIHEPSRLAILTILRRDGNAHYSFIRRLTGLSKGNLSNHLAKLEEEGLVDVGKHFEGKKPITTAALSAKGRETLEAYWGQMERIAAESRRRPTGRNTPAVGTGTTARQKEGDHAWTKSRGAN